MLAGFSLLAVLVFWSAWRSPAQLLVGRGSDLRIFTWFLRWTPFAFGSGHDPLFSDYVNYPQGISLMWNTWLPLPGLLVAPVTVTLGPLVAYNLLVTTGLALSAWCAYLAIREFVEHRWAAVVGGLLYGFSPYMLAQSLQHLQLVLLPFPPLLLLVLKRLLDDEARPVGPIGILLGTLVAAQLLIAEEVVASAALTVAIGLLLLAACCRRAVRRQLPRLLKVTAITAPVVLVLVGWPLARQFFGPGVVHGVIHRGAPEVDLLGFVVPTARQLITVAGAPDIVRQFKAGAVEQDAYLGVPLIVVMVVAAVRLRRNPVALASAMCAAILCLLAMGGHMRIAGRPTVVLPWRLAEDVPLVREILPNRLSAFVFLLAGLVLAMWVDASHGRARAWAWLAVALALVPLVPRLPYPTTRPAVPAFFTSAEVRAVPQGSVALVWPAARWYNADAMLWQAVSDMRFRMPAAYAVAQGPTGTSVYSPGITSLERVLRNVQTGKRPPVAEGAVRDAALQQLAVWRLDLIIVQDNKTQRPVIAFLTSLIGQPPERTGGVATWRLLDGRPAPGRANARR